MHCIVRDWFDCTALTVSDDVVACHISVRTRGMEKKGDVVVGVYYLSPSWDCLFYKQSGKLSRLAALVHMGDSEISAANIILL